MPKNVTVGLCLLVWNELKGCQEDVPKLPLQYFDEVFSLDGGSTDGTIDYLVSQGIPVVKQPLPGYNRAYISAFERTTCDALVIFHPKGSIDPATLIDLVASLRNGEDLVIASRNARGSRNEEDDKLLKPRKWFVLALSALSAALWWRGDGPIVWDVLHGYRAMRRDAFFDIEPIPEGLSMDLQMVVRSYRLRLRRCEIPVRESVRVDGSTHFKAFPTGKKLLQYMAVELKRPKPVRLSRQTAASAQSSSSR